MRGFKTSRFRPSLISLSCCKQLSSGRIHTKLLCRRGRPTSIRTREEETVSTLLSHTAHCRVPKEEDGKKKKQISRRWSAYQRLQGEPTPRTIILPSNLVELPRKEETSRVLRKGGLADGVLADQTPHHFHNHPKIFLERTQGENRRNDWKSCWKCHHIPRLLIAMHIILAPPHPLCSTSHHLSSFQPMPSPKSQ